MLSGSVVPAVFTLAMIFFIISAILPDAAAARERKSPAAGGRKEDSAQKTPDRNRDHVSRDRPADQRVDRPSRDRGPDRPSGDRGPDRPARDRSKERDPRPEYGRKERPAETRERKDQTTGTAWRRRPPREIDKTQPYDRGKRKEKGPRDRDKKKDGRDSVMPVFRGGHRWRRPRPPVIYCDYTNIYYYNYTYVYQPIYLPELPDGGLYEIGLPFGPILPWEIGEFYLIRLKYLEKEGLGGSVMITIIQTRDEMGWEEFLERFGDRITEVRYYGPVGLTSFLVAMTVSDILDLMLDNEIRWAGEFYPEYKIVPGGRNTKFYVLSLEGDTIEFRRELRDAGVFVMQHDPETGEYFVRSSRDNYDRVASLWWVARVSCVPGEPFFLPDDEWIDVGMAP
jgi:hypothetical protein